MGEVIPFHTFFERAMPDARERVPTNAVPDAQERVSTSVPQ